MFYKVDDEYRVPQKLLSDDLSAVEKKLPIIASLAVLASAVFLHKSANPASENTIQDNEKDRQFIRTTSHSDEAHYELD